MTKELHSELAQILIREDQIQKRVSELAAPISEDYRNEGSIMLVSILKGSFMFVSDIVRQLTIPHYVDFMALSSYGMSSESGAVRVLLDLN